MSLENIKQSISNWMQLDTFGALLTYGTLGAVAICYLLIH